MCNGFGMIVSSELNGYFTAPDRDGDISHSDILKALGWKDNENRFSRRFVRIECPDWTIASFRFDEDESLPGWADENADAIRGLVENVLEKAAPAYAEYEKVRNAAYAEFEKVRDAAYAEFEKVRNAAYAEYEKVRDAAETEMITALRKITGYVE